MTAPLLERALGTGLAAWRALDPDGAAAHARGVPPAASRPPEAVIAWARAQLEGAPICNALGTPLVPTLDPPRDEEYEHAILHRGVMAFRPRGSHDWFNLFTWRRWPLAKAALNLRAGLHHQAARAALVQAGARLAPGQRLQRDRWGQRLANLDEGGCVVRADWLAAATAADDHGVLRASAPPAAGADLWLFGHAALELLHDAPDDPALARLRMFVLPIAALDDELLARRILTLDPSLEPALSPLLPDLMALRPRGFFTAALRFAPGDPFAAPFRSLALPWPAPAA